MLVVVFGVGQAIFGPALTSIVPDIVPSDQLVEANSLAQFSRPFAMTLLGPRVGGILVGMIGAGRRVLRRRGHVRVLGADDLLMRTVRGPRPGGRRLGVAPRREGSRYVRGRPWFWAGMAAATISLLCTWGPWEVLVPFLVTNDLGGGAGALGLVFGAGGARRRARGASRWASVDLPRRPITLLYLAWAVSACS